MKQDIIKLQEFVKDNAIAAYVVFTSDDHGSEYIVDRFKTREFLCGFTGSAGTLVVTKDNAYLWTDGRYFIQAAEQLKATDTVLMKAREPGVPTIFEFVKTLSDTPKIAFDFKTATVEFVEALKKEVKGVQLVDCGEIIDRIWTDRPQIEPHEAWFLSDNAAGQSVKSKIADLQKDVEKYGCEACLVSSLDDIAWLLNMRGEDIQYNPVNYAYAIVTSGGATLFADERKFNAADRRILVENGVELRAYDEVYDAVCQIDGAVLIDTEKTNYALYSRIKNAREIDVFPTTVRKAVKNAVEIKNMKKAHVEDGVAVVRFMRYLKEKAGKEEMSEISLADKLEEFRRLSKNFLDLSFDTICGYAANGAIVHYSATPETNKKVENHGLLLVDSGAQYRYGTTDITRTFAMGKVSKEEKRAFTVVLKSHIALARATFLKGTSGARLDMISREPMYEYGMDFNHGTGHGVGYLLNVHEGPQNISPRAAAPRFAVQPGMITSNEPGFYKEGKFGIRHENLVLCVEKEKTECGTFCKFETITLVPFDLDAIDVNLLDEGERAWLNEYHERVRKVIGKHLEGKDLKFLEKATRRI